MHRSTALTAVAALSLTVIAGLSAVAVTLDQGAATSSPPPAAVQYVDQYGNPVDPPSSTASDPASSTGTPAADSSSRPVVVAPSREHEDEGEED